MGALCPDKGESETKEVRSVSFVLCRSKISGNFCF
jgi:hypothetical protein